MLFKQEIKQNRDIKKMKEEKQKNPVISLYSVLFIGFISYHMLILLNSKCYKRILSPFRNEADVNYWKIR